MQQTAWLARLPGGHGGRHLAHPAGSEQLPAAAAGPAAETGLLWHLAGDCCSLEGGFQQKLLSVAWEVMSLVLEPAGQLE